MLEIIVTPTSFSSLNIDEADAFVIGEAEYALRLPVYFSREELFSAIELIKNKGKKVYLAVNKILHEYELENVESYLEALKAYPIDGFIFGDLALYRIAKKIGIVERLIYNPETYITNYQSVNFYHQKNIKRVVLAKEITLEDITEIGNRSLIELEILGHGALNMFHSKRELVTNYFKFIKNDDSHHNEQLYLIEEKRQEEKYPIIEDHNGTHIFSGADLCTIDYLDEFIESNITSIRIDGFLKSEEELENIVKVYYQAINDYQMDPNLYRNNKENYIKQLKEIKNIRQFNTGFLFKKTVYKG